MTSLGDETADVLPFAVQMTGPGRGEISLDGARVENHIVGFQITASAGADYPTVVLQVSGGPASTTAFDGLARVYVQEDEPLDPGPAAAVFLAAIDAEELEKAALNRLDLSNGPGGLTKAMLQQLVEWASGRA